LEKFKSSEVSKQIKKKYLEVINLIWEYLSKYQHDLEKKSSSIL
jgi:hypothetical protein